LNTGHIGVIVARGIELELKQWEYVIHGAKIKAE
jgi:hypothetical protein